MKIILKNIGTDFFARSQKSVIGAPSPWSIFMFLTSLIGEASKKLENPLKVNEFTYILHDYYEEKGLMSEPMDSNRKCIPLKSFKAHEEIKMAGIKDNRNARLRLSIVVDIDENDTSSIKVLNSIRNSFFAVKLCGGFFNNDTLMRPIDKTILTIEDEANIMIELQKLGGFICRSLYSDNEIVSGSQMIDRLLYDTTFVFKPKKSSGEDEEEDNEESINTSSNKGKDIKERPNAVRSVLTGYASISGVPVDRKSSRDDKNHIFAEPVFRLVEWVPMKRGIELCNRDRWHYEINETKTVFVVKQPNGETHV